MPIGQLFVRRPVPLWHVAATMCLCVAGCGTSDAEVDAQAALAEQALAQGDIVTARMAIDEALNARGDDARLYMLSAQINSAQNNYADAYDDYQTVLALDPNNYQALVAVAVIARALGDPVRGRAAIERALAIDPTQIDVLMSKGLFALQKKDFAEAGKVADLIIEAHPDQPIGAVLKARALALQGREADALKLLRETIELKGNSVPLATALLETARAAGDVALMREQYALIATEKKDSAALALDEINLLYKIGDIAAARRAGEDMLRRFGEDAVAMGQLAALWEEYDPDPLGSNPQAIATIEGQDARLMVGRFLLARGRLDEAGQVVRARPDPALGPLGTRIAAREGNGGAVNAARAIVAEDTTNCDALGTLADDAVAKGHVDEAVRRAQVIASQCKDRIDGFRLQVRAYEAARRPAAVERVYRDGVAAHPQSVALARDFATWLLARGRPDAAVAIATRLTRANPYRNSGWKLLADVCAKAGDSPCVARAKAGLAKARITYQFEPTVGGRDVNLLLGRQWD